MPTHKAINKWWPIGLGISSILLFAIGGGLYGNCLYTDGYDVYISLSRYYTGIALLCLGAVAFIAFIVMSIVWLSRRNKKHDAESQPNFAPAAFRGSMAAPAPAYDTMVPNHMAQPVYQEPQKAMLKPESVVRANQVQVSPVISPVTTPSVGKFCGNCGTQTEHKYCTSCGAVVSELAG